MVRARLTAVYFSPSPGLNVSRISGTGAPPGSVGSGVCCSDGSGTGVSPVRWWHDSHGRDARATTLEAPWPPQFLLPWPRPSRFPGSFKMRPLRSTPVAPVGILILPPTARGRKAERRSATRRFRCEIVPGRRTGGRSVLRSSSATEDGRSGGVSRCARALLLA